MQNNQKKRIFSNFFFGFFDGEMEEWQKWIECKKYGLRFFVFIYFYCLYIYAFLFAVRYGDKGVLIYTFLCFSAYCMYKERKDKMGIIQKQKMYF